MGICCLCTRPRGFETKCSVHENTPSFQFFQKIPATPSSEGILLLDEKILSEIEGHRQRLERQQKKLNKAQEKEKNEKIERMKQVSTENMTIAVLKQLFKYKGIASLAKTQKNRNL